MAALAGIDEALARVLARVVPLGDEEVALRAAAGRVVARPVRATVDLPPFASSAMDGYAVRASDTPGRLVVSGHAAAGRPEARPVERGEAAVVSTGAVVPAGADAVVPVEATERAGDAVRVSHASPGDHIRPQGGDVRSGDVVVGAGTVLLPSRLGALAAVGVDRVRCARRPRVVVLSTGTELQHPGRVLGPGEIYESNSVLLGAALESAGAEVRVLDPAADDEPATRAALEQGLEADVLVTSGGVSVGPHDLVRAVLAELGAEEVFWRVAVKPGKPIAFSVRGPTLVFGLPGNPVSALVGFELFVRPAVRALQGAEPGPHYRPGRLASPLQRDPQRDQLVRARVASTEDAVVLTPLSGQASHMIVRAADADALVAVPRGTGELEAGAVVRWLPL